jgi:hypothetical protein
MRRLLAISLVFGVAACTGGEGDGDDVPPGVVDVRVPIPEPSDDYVDLVTPDIQIEAGEEKMYCIYIDNDLGEFAVNSMEALQGDFGHHIVLLTTIDPKPGGTLEDCTSQEEMWKFRSFVLPGNELPAGHGIRVPDQLQYVMQIHYVNTGLQPILVRDVARLARIDVEAVDTWVTTLTTNSLRLELPEGPGVESFDCTLAEDLDLLLLGGHMHENGVRFEIEVGPSEDALESMYLVDPWMPRYRDAPPVTLFFSAPRRLAAGTIVRTTCEWENVTGDTVAFPAEMCASFGYLAGTSTPFHCEPPEE